MHLLGECAGVKIRLRRSYPAMLRLRRSQRLAVYRPRRTRYSTYDGPRRIPSIDEPQHGAEPSARQPNPELRLRHQALTLQRKLNNELRESSRLTLLGHVAHVTEGSAWLRARLTGRWRKELVVMRGRGEIVLGTSRCRLPRRLRTAAPIIEDYLAYRLAQATLSE